MRPRRNWNTAAVLAATIAIASPAFAGTAFSYQGRLTDSGGAMNAFADLQFTLMDADIGGSPIGTPIEVLNYEVIDGLITVNLDFGVGAFDGSDRWLEIGVRTPPGAGAYTTLSPRVEVMATPYAQYAETVELVSNNAMVGTFTNPVSFASGSNSFSGSGAGLTGLNASNISSGVLSTSRLPSGGTWTLGSTLDLDFGTLAVDSINNHVGIGGVSNPLAPMHVRSSNIGVNSSMVGANGDLVIEATDAVIQMFSDNAGSVGSAIVLGEVVGGALNDTWLMRRNTSGTGSTLKFSHTDGGLLSLTPDSRIGIATSNPETSLHISTGTDATPTSGGYLLLGPTTGENVVIDDNEIMARNNGAPATLNLQVQGGDVHVSPFGSGRLGIGTSTPAEILHVDGNARIDGSITIDTVTRYLAISAIGFVPDWNAHIQFTGGGPGVIHGGSVVSNAVGANAHVELPHGARITELRAYIDDADAVANASVDLYEVPHQGTTFGTQLAVVSSSGSGGMNSYGTALSHVVNNQANAYIVAVDWTAPLGAIKLRSVRITYTITQPLP